MIRPGAALAALTAWAALAACAGSPVESRAATEGSVAASTAPSAPVSEPASDVSSTVARPPTSTTLPAPTTTSAPVLALEGWDAVDRYLEIAVLRGGSRAVSAAVMRDGELLHQVALGVRTSAGEPLTTADRFRVASISKTITAIVVLRLVEDGVLGLDAPVGPALAEHLGVSGAAGVDAITTRHLLTHRSGFAQYEDLFFAREVESCPDAARAGLSRPLRDVPGASFRYSNLNFCLLGLLIEIVTGESYESAVDTRLLAPLGIDGMRLAGTFDVGPGEVEHRSDEGRNYMEVLGAAGAWVASPTDLVTILGSLDATTDVASLGSAMVAEMTTITTDPPAPPAPDAPDAPSTTPAPLPAPESGYGMGLMIFGPGSHGHTGTVESTHAMVVRRSDGIVWALTVSGDYPSSTRQLARIMDNALLLGGFTDGALVTVPPPLD